MNKNQLSKEFKFESVSEVTERLALAVQEMQIVLERMQNQESFSLDSIQYFYERVELAHQILFRIACLEDPQSRIEDLLYQLRENDAHH